MFRRQLTFPARLWFAYRVNHFDGVAGANEISTNVTNDHTKRRNWFITRIAVHLGKELAQRGADANYISVSYGPAKLMSELI